MTRLALPCTSPTRKFSCASAIFRVSLMCAAREGSAVYLAAFRRSFKSAAPAARRAARLTARGRTACALRGRLSRGSRAARLWGLCRALRYRRSGRAPLAQQRGHGGTELRGRFDGAHPRGGKRGVLVRRRTLAAGDDGTGVAHALAGRGGDAGDIGDDRLADEAVDVARRRLLI